VAKKNKPLEWIGFGMPLQLVRFAQIARVELREVDGTIHLSYCAHSTRQTLSCVLSHSPASGR
jgi:hypothetical protein